MTMSPSSSASCAMLDRDPGKPSRSLSSLNRKMLRCPAVALGRVTGAPVASLAQSRGGRRPSMSRRTRANAGGGFFSRSLPRAGLTCALWPATTWPAKVGSMNDTPTQHGLPPELDRIAHERRARLIAQLHRQAMATANDLAVRQTAIKADIAKDARRQAPRRSLAMPPSALRTRTNSWS